LLTDALKTQMRLVVTPDHELFAFASHQPFG
jgi:hypothetical protein